MHKCCRLPHPLLFIGTPSLTPKEMLHSKWDYWSKSEPAATLEVHPATLVGLGATVAYGCNLPRHFPHASFSLTCSPPCCGHCCFFFDTHKSAEAHRQGVGCCWTRFGCLLLPSGVVCCHYVVVNSQIYPQLHVGLSHPMHVRIHPVSNCHAVMIWSLRLID